MIAAQGTASPKDLALFDFDGTITDRETMPDFMRMAVRRHRLWSGYVVLMPWLLGYKAGIVSGNTVRALICLTGFKGVPVDEVDGHGIRFAKEVLPDRLREDAMARIEWHKARGDDVAVVSGGLDVYLGRWCEQHGLELLCSSLEQRDGRLTGRYRGTQCAGAEKARRVRDRFELVRYGRVFAYGDTAEDDDLLALADERWFRGRPVPA